MLWLTENLATILVSLVVLAIVTLVIAGMIRDKRKGKSVTCGGCSGCSGNCAHCRAAHAEAIRTAREAKANTGRQSKPSRAV